MTSTAGILALGEERDFIDIDVSDSSRVTIQIVDENDAVWDTDTVVHVLRSAASYGYREFDRPVEFRGEGARRLDVVDPPTKTLRVIVKKSDAGAAGFVQVHLIERTPIIETREFA